MESGKNVENWFSRKKQKLDVNISKRDARLSGSEEIDGYIFEDLYTADTMDNAESDDEYIFADLPCDNLKEEEFGGQSDENKCSQTKLQESGNVFDANIKQEVVEHNVEIKTERTKKTRIPSEVLKCDKCDHTTPYKSNLNVHKKNVHQQVTSICNYCSKEFKHLKVHIDAVHEKSTYKCDQCEFVCNIKKGLRCHICRRHINYHVRHTCPFCFRKVEHLDAHIQKVHENTEQKEKSVKCDKCPYSTTSKNNLLGHTRSSHKLVTVTCNICNKDIKEMKKSAHMKKHMGNQFSCAPCAKTYRERRDLAGHILYVHKEHRTTCTYCDKKVTNLRMHVKWLHKDVDPSTIDISTDLQMMYRIKQMLGELYVYSGEFDNDQIEIDYCTLGASKIQGGDTKLSENGNGVDEKMTENAKTVELIAKEQVFQLRGESFVFEDC